MNSDWALLTFSDAPFSIIDGDRGTNYPKQHDFSATGHCLFLNAGNVTKDGFSFTDCAFISEEKDLSLRKGKLQRHDIVLTTRGTVGNVAYYSDGIKFESIRINSGMVIFRPDSSKILPYYLYLFLRSSSFAEQVKSLTSGSAQPQLPIRDMNRITIPVPSLEIQAEICFLLGAVDDRIALLRETNATLEAIAQALFKSWFVDFDPVHANAGTQAPSLPPEIQALFPATFTNSPQGPIPEGWKVGTLSELAEFQNGYAFKSKDWVDTGHPVVKIGDVKPGIIDFSGCSYVTQDSVKSLERFKLNRGDLLVGMTGYVGETGLVPRVEPAAYINQRVGRFSTKRGLHDCGLVYCIVRNSDFKTYAEAQSHGSAQANISGTALQGYPCILPTSNVVDLFNSNSYPLLDCILSNHEKALSLANLRDTLLPRLISGQLRLPEAEQAIAAITD